MTSSCLPCRRLTLSEGADLNAVRLAFEPAEAIPLGQAWLSRMEKHFRPAFVKVAWQPGVLLIFAELEDDDIHNAASRLNDNTWELGDVFELFLRNMAKEEYLELHVTPENQRLQLRIPSLAELVDREKRHAVMDDFKVTTDMVDSRAWVDSPGRIWSVLVRVPLHELALPAESSGAEILFSFSRYDYTRGMDLPVLSSTSPHRELNFHRQHEWKRMVLIPESPLS